MKVHIIGIAGSGKTTLAASVSRAFGVPAYDLDFVVYDAERGERSEAEIVSRLDGIRCLEAWATEGAYRNHWLRPLLDDAEAIVWLDFHFVTCTFRMVKRHVRAELARDNLHPGWRRLLDFLNYTRRTAVRQKAETLDLLLPYEAKVVRCRSSRDIASFKARSGI